MASHRWAVPRTLLLPTTRWNVLGRCGAPYALNKSDGALRLRSWISFRSQRDLPPKSGRDRIIKTSVLSISAPPSQRATQGSIAALADGFGAKSGRVASELAVRAFVDGYRSQREPVGVAAAAMKSLNAYNLWLHGQSRSDPALLGAATTFTAAVLLGRIATILHVGDSRAWHLRADHLTLLTDDHSAPQADGSRRLLRAIGLEPALRLDVKAQPLEAYDRLFAYDERRPFCPFGKRSSETSQRATNTASRRQCDCRGCTASWRRR